MAVEEEEEDLFVLYDLEEVDSSSDERDESSDGGDGDRDLDDDNVDVL